MTKEELDKLTDEEKRERIAALCGFSEVMEALPEKLLIGTIVVGGFPVRRIVPDYLNSLDAMHEAERTLTSIQLGKYAHTLQEETLYWCVGVVPDHHADLHSLGCLITTVAYQRARAFLLTVG